jgi:microcystin-dependent protein
MPTFDVSLIDKNECVGNSLSSINSNFTALTSELLSLTDSVAVLNTRVAEFSAFGVSKINVAGDYLALLSPETGIGSVTLSAGNPYAGQELLSATNIGANYGIEVFKEKSNKSLHFRKIISGSTNIQVTQDGDNVKITGLNSDSTPLGEANTATNEGVGEGIVLPKSGTNLPFKTLISGSGISLTPEATTLTINSTVSGENVGAGSGQLLKSNTHPFQIRKLKEGKNIDIITSGDDVIISATDSVSVDRAHPDGAFIFKEKLNDDLLFKTIKSASPHILIEDRPNDIHISTVDLLSGGMNVGTGKELLAKQENNLLSFRTLLAGKNIELFQTEEGIQIQSFVPAVAGFNGLNFGTGTAVFSGQNGFELYFKTLSAGNGINLNDEQGTLSLSVTDEVIYKTINVTNLIEDTSHGLYAGKTEDGILQFKSLSSVGTALVVTSHDKVIRFDSTNALTDGINSTVGTGTGKVLKQNADGVLEFKKIKAGEGIIVNNGNDDITISAKSTIDAFIPAGAVMAFARKTAPSGWLICNGDEVPNGVDTVQGVRADFSSLYTAVGTSFGSLGKLPDLRGEFIRGWDYEREVDRGRVFGSNQNGTAVIIDPNRSTASVCSPINRSDKAGGNQATSWLDNDYSSEDVGADHILNARDTWPNLLNAYQSTNAASVIELNTGGFGTGATRPRNVALLYCIKY